MARFVSWWTTLDATPESVAGAAERAGVLVEAGDYTIGQMVLDEEDDEPSIDLNVEGALVSAGDETWVVYPAPSARDGWRAQVIRFVGGQARVAHDLGIRQLGAADDPAVEIISAFLAGSAPSERRLAA